MAEISIDKKSPSGTKKKITLDNISIEHFSTYPLSKSVPNKKIIFSELPFWVRDQEIIDSLSQQPWIIIKSGVIVSRHRDEHNRLTEYYNNNNNNVFL